MDTETLIVGIGSAHGDDQIGWRVAERIEQGIGQAGARVRKARSPVELMDWLDGVQRLVICDACRGLGRVGQVQRWTWPAQNVVGATWSGTHDLPLPAVLQLAERLGRLPPEVIIWSMEAGPAGQFQELSPAAAAALPEMVRRVTGS